MVTKKIKYVPIDDLLGNGKHGRLPVIVDYGQIAVDLYALRSKIEKSHFKNTKAAKLLLSDLQRLEDDLGRAAVDQRGVMIERRKQDRGYAGRKDRRNK